MVDQRYLDIHVFMDLLTYHFMYRLFTALDSGLFAVYLRLTFWTIRRYYFGFSFWL